MLDDRDTARLNRLATDARAALGQNLRALVLYGEAASPAYRPDQTPLTTVLLVDVVQSDLLRRLLPVTARSRRQGLPVPLVFDEAHLRTSRDVFPLELLAIHDQHLAVWGDSDPFAASPIAQDNLECLRLEVEEHLKGKLLHLRQAYLEARGRKRVLRAMLLDAVIGFEIVLRGLLCLAGHPRPTDAAELVRAAAQACGVDLPALAQIREGRVRGTLPLSDVPTIFERTLEEVAALAQAADRFFKTRDHP